jgi:hypothetical protein
MNSPSFNGLQLFSDLCHQALVCLPLQVSSKIFDRPKKHGKHILNIFCNFDWVDLINLGNRKSTFEIFERYLSEVFVGIKKKKMIWICESLDVLIWIFGRKPRLNPNNSE